MRGLLICAVHDPVKNRVVLTMRTDSAGTGVTVYRVETCRDDDQTTWTTVTGLGRIEAKYSSDADIAVYDYTAPLNRRSWYQVMTYSLVDGRPFGSPHYSNTLSVTPQVSGHWLKGAA